MKVSRTKGEEWKFLKDWSCALHGYGNANWDFSVSVCEYVLSGGDEEIWREG